MAQGAVTVVWFRRDLRVDDNHALIAASLSGAVVPIFVWSPEEEGQFYPGRASRWWLKKSLKHLSASLQGLGAPLIVRRSRSTLAVLLEVIAITGATQLFYNHLYDPVSLVRDHRVNEALSERGILVRSFNGDLLHEPWEMAACTGGAGAGAGAGAVAGSGTRAVAGAVGSELQKGTGDRLAGGAGADAGTGAGVGALTGAGAQQAMTLKASQKTVANTSSAVDKGLTFDNFFQQWLLQTPRPPLAAPTSLVVPPAAAAIPSQGLDSLGLESQDEKDSNSLLSRAWLPGCNNAQRALLSFFHGGPLLHYSPNRGKADSGSTSLLSPHLHFGELSVRRIYLDAMKMKETWAQEGHALGSHSTCAFLRSIALREYSRFLVFNFPFTHNRSLLCHLQYFPWRADETLFKAWRQGRTGYPLVDAGMRELWATGWMHNRLRVVTASFCVKYLQLPWQWGMKYFWDALLDADLECDVLGWQYVSGSLPDGHEVDRMDDPEEWGIRIDPDGEYIRRWLPELSRLPTRWLYRPGEAPPEVLRAAGVELGYTYPRPVVDVGTARHRLQSAIEEMAHKEAAIKAAIANGVEEGGGEHSPELALLQQQEQKRYTGQILNRALVLGNSVPAITGQVLARAGAGAARAGVGGHMRHQQPEMTAGSMIGAPQFAPAGVLGACAESARVLEVSLRDQMVPIIPSKETRCAAAVILGTPKDKNVDPEDLYAIPGPEDALQAAFQHPDDRAVAPEAGGGGGGGAAAATAAGTGVGFRTGAGTGASAGLGAGASLRGAQERQGAVGAPSPAAAGGTVTAGIPVVHPGAAGPQGVSGAPERMVWAPAAVLLTHDSLVAGRQPLTGLPFQVAGRGEGQGVSVVGEVEAEARDDPADGADTRPRMGGGQGQGLGVGLGATGGNEGVLAKTGAGGGSGGEQPVELNLFPQTAIDDKRHRDPEPRGLRPAQGAAQGQDLGGLHPLFARAGVRPVKEQGRVSPLFAAAAAAAAAATAPGQQQATPGEGFAAPLPARQPEGVPQGAPQGMLQGMFQGMTPGAHAAEGTGEAPGVPRQEGLLEREWLRDRMAAAALLADPRRAAPGGSGGPAVGGGGGEMRADAGVGMAGTSSAPGSPLRTHKRSYPEGYGEVASAMQRLRAQQPEQGQQWEDDLQKRTEALAGVPGCLEVCPTREIGSVWGVPARSGH